MPRKKPGVDDPGQYAPWSEMGDEKDVVYDPSKGGTEAERQASRDWLDRILAETPDTPRKRSFDRD